MPSSPPSELLHHKAHELHGPALAPPGPALEAFPSSNLGSVGLVGKGGLPSFQDLTDDSGSEEEGDGEGSGGEGGDGGWEEWVQRAESLLSDSKIDEIHDYLRERGLFAFLKRYLDGYHDAAGDGGATNGATERMSVEVVLMAFGVRLRPGTSIQDQLRMLKIACSRVLRNRAKLETINTPQDVVDLIRKSKNILILTGAGVSTSCGIPDFRSPTGLYARLKEENWELDDPQDMFDLTYFKQKPNVFYGFAKEIYPSNFVPSPCHRFVRLLELNDRLLRNYTQNIDGLFELVGVEKMLNCHGSFATASCLLCHARFPGSSIEKDVFASRVPLCPFCTPKLALLEAEEEARKEREKAEPPRKKAKKSYKEEWEEESGEEEEGDEGRGEWEGKALIKPDIVFFGEALSDEFDRRLLEDREEVDLLLVMGTSLRVSPVAQLPSHLPHSIPQILINRDPVSHHNFDVSLLGDGDTIVQWLCDQLAKPPSASFSSTKTPPALAAAASRQWDLNSRVPIVLPSSHAPASSTTSSTLSSLPLSTSAASPGAISPSALPQQPPFPSLPAPHLGVSPSSPPVPERVGNVPHLWLFPGANRESKWVERMREAYASDAENDDEEDKEGGGSVELPAGLAPGVKEGEGSDGDESIGTESDDGEEGGQPVVPKGEA